MSSCQNHLRERVGKWWLAELSACTHPLTQVVLTTTQAVSLRTEKNVFLFRAINISPLQGEEEIQFGPRESAIVNP